MTIWNGITEQGAIVPIQVDAQGRVVVSGGSGPSSEVYGTAKAHGLFDALGNAIYSTNCSCSRTAEGKYLVTFTQAFPDTKFSTLVTASWVSTRICYVSATTTSSVQVSTETENGTHLDAGFSIAVFDERPAIVSPLILPTSTVNEVKALRAEIDKLKKAKNP